MDTNKHPLQLLLESYDLPVQSRGTMWVWEPGVWEAKWVSGAWVITV